MSNPFYQRSFIDIQQHSKEELEFLILIAKKLKALDKTPHLLDGKVIANCFFEPSTRTRLSFDSAICRLNGKTIGFDNAQNTSGKKGETLRDTARMLSAYADAIIIRHPQAGSAHEVDQFSGDIPVINAGDGANQHPTQTLLDLFTIYETQGRLDNLSVTFSGDLKYGRTVHSLVQALSKFKNNKIGLLSPKSFALPSYLLAHLEEQGVEYRILNSMDDALNQSDIVYMTRMQKERMSADEHGLSNDYILDLDKLSQASPARNLKILHPLPRVDEISEEIDDTDFAYYFEQAKNGVYARQALLTAILNKNINL